MKLATLFACGMVLASAVRVAAQVGAPPAPPPQMAPNPGMAPNTEMAPNPGMAPNTEMAPNPEMAPADTPLRPGGPDIGDTRLEPTPPNATVE